ncbi:hypothetical protein [Nocardioides sp. LS1]|uniref:hypothetical protein n=1 Tax=Nocardioides sp. LS1 TaxID=1027620 RepID=UPI000F619BCA|nr:hypothetical protein [Nocardioides sp. LS1]GCD88789.1 hypothetical protein NLS1_07950 [Nocardioides sp. LS1]
MKVARGAAGARFAPVAWGTGALASLVLVLGVNGTLSSWTQAVINNGTNNAESALAVALSETDGVATCDTVADSDNSITCSINKFGGTTTKLSPGDTRDVDVTFTNTGSGDAARLKLTPGTCVDPDPGTTLCADDNFQVSVTCSDGATYDDQNLYTDLVWAADDPSHQAEDAHVATISPDDQITCRITVSLAATAPASVSNTTVSQPLTWTLSAT